MEGNYFTLNKDAVVLNTFARIKTTTAVKNAGWGIYAPRATDLGGNVAYSNLREPQCMGVTCAGR